MMDWTDRHCRFFLRLLSPHALLYTEMVTAQAILHGDRERLLGFDASEHPLALQIGGSDPAMLAKAARIGAEFGYDEINLNVGCPSDRVQSGSFGACLMAEAGLVRDCVAAMGEVVDVPVTVKSRIGIDDHDDYEFLAGFVETVAESGCRVFIVHARKAILSGLSPKENREIPPLKYDYVHRLKRDFPELTVVLNGGLRDLGTLRDELTRVDGAMIGREAYQNPYFLALAEEALFGVAPPGRGAVVEAFLPYLQAWLAKGVRLSSMTRHILGLYAGQPGARRWRRRLSEGAANAGGDAETVRRALAEVA